MRLFFPGEPCKSLFPFRVARIFRGFVKKRRKLLFGLNRKFKPLEVKVIIEQS